MCNLAILIEGGIAMEDILRAQLIIIKTMDLKPNFSELSRKYGYDRRTVKKYYDGYEGKPMWMHRARVGVALSQVLLEVFLLLFHVFYCLLSCTILLLDCLDPQDL